MSKFSITKVKIVYPCENDLCLLEEYINEEIERMTLIDIDACKFTRVIKRIPHIQDIKILQEADENAFPWAVIIYKTEDIMGDRLQLDTGEWCCGCLELPGQFGLHKDCKRLEHINYKL